MAKKNDHSLVEVATKTQSPFWDLNMSESMTIFKGFFKLVASCEKMAIATSAWRYGQAVDLTKGLFLDSANKELSKKIINNNNNND